MHELRKSFMDKEAAEDSEAAALQAAIMEENKNYREEIKKLEEEKSSIQKNISSKERSLWLSSVIIPRVFQLNLSLLQFSAKNEEFSSILFPFKLDTTTKHEIVF